MFDAAKKYLLTVGSASKEVLDELFWVATDEERESVIRQLEIAGVISEPDSQGNRYILEGVELV